MELYHGRRWNTDPRFRTPMEGCTDVFAAIDVLLDGAQFNRMCEGPPITLSHDAAVLYGNMELPLSCIHGVAAAPQCIVKWHGEEDKFEQFDSEVTVQYLTPHPIKGKAAGRKVVMVPLILFSDGNRSKKWHKFESLYMYLPLAGLPRKDNMQRVNIHFICSSDSVTPLEMAEPIARELATLENEGFEVFDAYSNENVLVVAPLLLVVCDNPRASELLNHLGSAAKYVLSLV